MITVTTPDVPGKEIYQTIGIVKGNTIRAKNVFRDIGAGLKSIVGGELKDYTKMLTEARDEALDRMVQQAQELGANAVVNVRMTSADVMGSAAEMLVYGTAVKVK
ncbi:YbjQ family protein [candidate division KSB1 bacterium]